MADHSKRNWLIALGGAAAYLVVLFVVLASIAANGCPPNCA